MVVEDRLSTYRQNNLHVKLLCSAWTLTSLKPAGWSGLTPDAHGEKKSSCENQIFHILCQQFSFLPLHPSVSSVFCFSFATNVILMLQSNYCAKKHNDIYSHS